MRQWLDDNWEVIFLIVVLVFVGIVIIAILRLPACPESGYDVTKCTTADMTARLGREVHGLREDLRTFMTAVAGGRR